MFWRCCVGLPWADEALRQTRERLEVALFVLATHLLALSCLLHLSFASPQGHVDCLGAFLPLPVDGADQFRVLRIQVRQVRT